MRDKQIFGRHKGGMHFVLTTGSGHELVVDDSAGESGPRPTETLLAALVGCTAMDVASLLVKKRQAVAQYTIEARGRQRQEYPQVFSWIDLVHVFAGPIDDVAVRRCIELSATKYCPINAMVSAGPTEVHHRYRIEEPADGPNPGAVREGEVMVTGPHGRIDSSGA